MSKFSKWLLTELLLLAALIVVIVIATALSHRLASSSLPSLSTRAPIHAPLHTARASWYGPGFFYRERADGKRYHTDDVFVAHKTYPMGTKLHVVNLRNHRSVDVTVRDRGPYIRGRDLDFSWRAAGLLGMQNDGVVLVAYNVIR